MADKLEYGWWEHKRGNVLLPEYLGDKRNFLLHAAEIEEYAKVLVAMGETIDKETKAVVFTRNALKTGHVASWETRDPQPITIASVLTFHVALAKHRLAMTQLLADVTGRRVKEKEDEKQTSTNQDGDA